MSNSNNGVVWDLTSYFPEFGGEKMADFKRKIEADVEKLEKSAAALGVLTDETAAEWESIFLTSEELITRLSHIASYVGCLAAGDAANEAYSQEEGKLAKLFSSFEKFNTEVLRGLKGVSKEVFDRFVARESFKGAEYYLGRLREIANYTMPKEMENLASDLNLDGISAWGRVYGKISGKLEFDMVYPDGKVDRKPISQWRSLMSDADRRVGKAAFEGGNKAWQSVEDVCAAALNSISGTRLTLNKYRGIDDYLYNALFQSSVSRETLDAMYKAIHDNIEIGREILRLKAKAMGRTGIYWFEREAPLPMDEAILYSWQEGSEMVGKAFQQAYPQLADYYKFALEKNWIESEPRPGKRPGAFCTGSSYTKEQRVYQTFNGAIGDVTTLAHEMGHAFHGHLMKDLRPMAKRYPMTLAETASIFAEHILADGIYRDDSISDNAKLLMLDADLCGSAILLLDITVRFEFEKELHDERMKGELSVSKLKSMIVNTQKRIFADSLLEESVDPYFWASKLHFYITQVTFYNFPYTMGFLLARALYNRFVEEGNSFLPQYENFLMLTGSDSVENVAKRTIGADVTDPAFWDASIKSLNRQIEQYAHLLEGRKFASAE